VPIESGPEGDDRLVKDPFSWSLEQRRRIIPDSPWFALAFVAAGLGNLLWGANDWPWWLLVDLALIVVGVVLFTVWARGRGSNAPP
jgi:hypothetical protein